MFAKRMCVALFITMTSTLLAFQPQKEIQVRVWCGGTWDDSYHWAGDPIAIDVTGCRDHINIWDRTSNPTNNIGPVTITGSRSSDITVTISSGAWRGLNDTQQESAGGNWGGITVAQGVGNHVLLEGHVSGNLTGLVKVGEVYRLDIDGQVNSGIQADRAGQGPFWLYAGSMGSSGNANSPNDSIALVRTLTGNLEGRISAAGDIGDIIVAGDILNRAPSPHIYAGGDITLIQTGDEVGDGIGEPGYPVTIEAGGVIKYINVPKGNLHADISATKLERTYGTPHDPCVDVGGDVADTTITLTDSIRDHFTITGGDFALTSETHMVHLADGGIIKIEEDDDEIGGSMLGEMYFSGVLGAESLIEIDHTLGGLLSFGGFQGTSLNDDIYIFGDLGAGEGLTGQIILNANATLNDSWGNGDVKFGPDGMGQTLLDRKPYYNNKSDDLGGGAVGLVPYYLHYNDCTPTATKVNENQTTGLDGLGECDEGYHARIVIPVNENNLDTVTVMHYGPVVQEGAGKPFTVKRKSLVSPMCVWEDRTSDFTHAMHPGGNTRAMKIDGPFAYGYDWLIEPVRTETDRLLCGETIAIDVPVKEYDFRVRVLKLQDIEPNGILQPDDIVAWILNPQDTTLDGTTDNNDLVDVINAVAAYGE